MDDKGEVTALLARISEGDRSAEESLLPRVYMELHRLAMFQLRGERPGHTLQATALVHEAYIRLCGAKKLDWKDRMHFYRVAAKLMHRILVDYARQKNAQKRGSGGRKESLEEAVVIAENKLALVLEVDELLVRLSKVDSTAGADCGDAVLRRTDGGGGWRRARYERAHRQAGMAEGARMAA